MPMCDIKDHKTGETLKAYDFGGPEIYYAGTSLVYAPLGGTSVSSSENLATLNPLGITSIMKQRWKVTGHVGIGTAGWRVSVVDTSTGETKDGVYPFNLQGNVYELECQPGTWVMASCGGYKIESSWVGQTTEQAYRLKGTGEIIYIYSISCVFGPGKDKSWAKVDYSKTYYDNNYTHYPYYSLVVDGSHSTGWYGPYLGTSDQVLEIIFGKLGYIEYKEEFPEYKIITDNSLTFNIKFFSKYSIGYGIRKDSYGNTAKNWFWVPHKSYVDFTITTSTGFLPQDVKDYYLNLTFDKFYEIF